jgi:hypothetical protein
MPDWLDTAGFERENRGLTDLSGTESDFGVESAT